MVWNRIAVMARDLGFDYEMGVRRSEDRENPIYIVRVKLGGDDAAEFATQSNDKASEDRGEFVFRFRISDNRYGETMPIYSNNTATQETVLAKVKKYLDGIGKTAVADESANSYNIDKHNNSEMNNKNNIYLESITDMVMDRILNESQMHSDLDEGFLGMFNGQKAQNRQDMRKANRELRKSGNPNARCWTHMSAKGTLSCRSLCWSRPYRTSGTLSSSGY